MLDFEQEYDVAIIGGGLAGLAAAILLNRSGHSVIILEKEKYPFHKVCGEYVSLESQDFLGKLGIPIHQMDLPRIDRFLLTAPDGRSFTMKLPLGGFGISRYKLDHMLAETAQRNGVFILEETKAEEIAFKNSFQISFNSRITDKKLVRAKICCAAYGKRSNIDIKWKRTFLDQNNRRLDNFVGIKYHIKTDWNKNVIGLHNFENGYCGISGIEDNKYCLCYMTRAEALKKNNNNILQFQENVLFQNPHLKKIFSTSEVLKNFPITISQINFNKKTAIENNIIMLGDAAGMIAPLCGNGMSIALHTAKIAAALIDQYLHRQISRDQLETTYKQQWHTNFSRRLRTGRALQPFFGNKRLSNLFVGTMKTFPFLAPPLVKMTHGKPF